MSLKRLGWNSYFAACWREHENPERLPGRVVGQQRGLWRVAGEFAECWAAPSGKLREQAEAGGLWPAVGDWVAAEIPGVLLAETGAAVLGPRSGRGYGSADKEPGERAIVCGVLPRRSQFVRKVAGRRVEAQVIAANVDLALVIAGLGNEYNVRRMERYLAQCWDSGAKAVLVLNKTDASGDWRERVAEAERIAMGGAVVAVSAFTGQGMEELERFFMAGETIVLLGSSGVGKSTLLNRLLGRNAQSVRAVRESDGRGRHTTTSRELFVLPNGTLVIDTPGLRELQLWDVTEGVVQAFGDIERLAEQCHFRDCSHNSEPGCAVQAAIAAGGLDAARLENRRKLEREQEFLRRKIDPEARQADKQRVKELHRGAKQIYEQRKREGGKE
jgi:ribosome biogenesis GTPase / thiamine phosphate phosphatase